MPMQLLNLVSLMILSQNKAVQTAPVRADRQAEVKVQLEALYSRGCALTKKQDVAGLTQFMTDTRTPDYEFIAKSGKTSLPEMIKSMKVVMADIEKVTTSTVRISRLKVNPTSVVATINSVFVFITKPGSREGKHAFSEQVVGDDAWVKVGAAWQLKQSSTTSEHLYRDGRPMLTQ